MTYKVSSGTLNLCSLTWVSTVWKFVQFFRITVNTRSLILRNVIFCKVGYSVHMWYFGYWLYVTCCVRYVRDVCVCVCVRAQDTRHL